jgi:transcriptional regulator with XRE-family HTH domain
MTARTVLPRPTGVNSLLTVPSDDRVAAAKRLRRFLLDLWTERGGDGSVNGLADATGVKRQQMYEWFSASVEPNLGSLEKLSKGLGVTRAEIVAAMDGQLPPPDWRRELREAIAGAISDQVEEAGRRGAEAALARAGLRGPAQRPRGGAAPGSAGSAPHPETAS